MATLLKELLCQIVNIVGWRINFLHPFAFLFALLVCLIYIDSVDKDNIAVVCKTRNECSQMNGVGYENVL